MRDRVRGMSSRTKHWLFGSVFGLCFVMAVAPPLYLWGDRQDPEILGLPFGVAYMLFDAVLLTAAVGALYWIEDIRGEVD
jgi:hypothetical protein